ncbi:hypothetical protein [Chondrinema litorale]|uniref:hypothetical protein n=1 Tax=Chondrinema litorale TaxID=2994555 RepID=UPI002543F802|nr:hypothetical protein [Chondrinema litorale]UZR98856.1 hypothetical protein OQ292_33225 [Chondrinema litorale]
MKNLNIILICLLYACSGIDKDSLKKELNDSFFEWHIQSDDTIKTQELYFFQDSIYVSVSKEDEQKIVHLNYWNTDQNLFYATLHLKEIIEDIEFRIVSYSSDSIKLSYKDESYSMLKIEPEKTHISNEIVGLWYAPADSIPIKAKEYSETRNFLTNPTFEFTKDSFNIYAFDYFARGKYKYIDGKTKLIILESIPYYTGSKCIILDSIDESHLNILLEDDISTWKRYELVRRK